MRRGGEQGRREGEGPPPNARDALTPLARGHSKITSRLEGKGYGSLRRSVTGGGGGPVVVMSHSVEFRNYKSQYYAYLLTSRQRG